MAKISQYAMRLFGKDGATGNFGKFGSAAAGSAVTTKDPDTIMALAAWITEGWADALVAGFAPFLQDLNGFCYVTIRKLAYFDQEGIPEWNTSNTYYIGSIVKKTGTFELYGSLVDDNTGNALPDKVNDSNWQYLGNVQAESKTSNFTASVGKVYLCDATSAAFTATLPTASSYANSEITFVKTDSSLNAVTLSGAINGRTSIAMWGQDQSITVRSNGSRWIIVAETASRPTSYTPTFQGLGTPSSVDYKFRSYWDHVEIEGSFVCGTATASEMRVGLPGSMVVSSTVSAKTYVGEMQYDSPGPNNEHANALVTASQGYMTFGRSGTSISSALSSNMNGNTYLGSGIKTAQIATIPINA